MSNFLDAAAQAARSNVCTLLGLPSYVNDMIERVGFPAYNNPLVAIPNFWRNLLCDTQGPDPNPPPYVGGQCPCVSYRVDFEYTNGVGQRVSVRSIPLTGPILGIGVRDVPGTREAFISHGLCSGGVQTGTQQTTVLVTAVIGSPAIVGVIRPDGQPDDCGDPEPVYEDLTPEDVTFDVDITFNNSSNVETTIEGTIIYARAQVLAVGAIIIPFTLQLSPTAVFSGTVNLNGEVNIYPVPNGTTTAPKDPRKSPCSDIPLPDGEVPEDPTDSDKEPDGDRDRKKVIKGVLVTVNTLGDIRATSILQDENPDIYAPNLGFVNFLVRVGTVSAGWTPDIPVKNRRCLIQCPWDDGAIDVKGTPQQGVGWTLTPIFGYAGVPVEYVQ